MSNEERNGGEGNAADSGPQRRLKGLLSEAGNGVCADCGSPDPKWVSLNIGVFICIKCSGIHRSLGVQTSKVLSIKLDKWTDEQVDSLKEIGGNIAVNLKYEAHIPENYIKPKPDSSTEERTDFIRKKYVQQQFLDSDVHQQPSSPLSSSSSPSGSSPSSNQLSPEKKHYEKLSDRIHSLGHAFRNSWRRSEHRQSKKGNLMAGMVEFVGMLSVNILRGTDLVVRDMLSSDPYVALSLGNQTAKTRVVKRNLNPVWNEKLMLSIPENIPPLKLVVYDKDTFSRDDFMGEAEIDIRPLFEAAKASEGYSSENRKGRVENIISMEDGKAKQDICIKLEKVESGVLEIQLQCMLLIQ